VRVREAKDSVRTWRRKAAALLGGAALGVGALLLLPGGVSSQEGAGNAPAKGGDGAAVVAATTRAPKPFLHAQHEAEAKKAKKDWTCAGCHTDGTGKAEESRPGKEDHKQCDSAGCHASHFYAQKEARTETAENVCKTCHVEGKFWADMSLLRPYPDKCYDAREFGTEFGHDVHLTGEAKLEGKALACKDCHRSQGGQLPVERREGDCHAQDDVDNPAHADCVRCHAADGGNKLTMKRCDGCHKLRTGPPEEAALKGWAARVRERFSHEKHYARQGTIFVKGEEVELDCGLCHVGIKDAKTVKDAIGLIGRKEGKERSHEICATCHGKARVKKGASEVAVFSTRDDDTSCSKCHRKDFVAGNFKSRLGGVFK
jgi:hypothetical protein